jgi:hypothetical protein
MTYPMFSVLKQSPIYNSDFEQLLTYDIAIPTDEDMRTRVEECRVDLAKRGLSASSPRGVLQKDGAGSLYMHLLRVQQLRGILLSHGWRQTK